MLTTAVKTVLLNKVTIVVVVTRKSDHNLKV